MSSVLSAVLQARAEVPPPLRRPKPLHFAYLAPPFDACLGELPAQAEAIPSMMSPSERQFLFGVAKNYYTGAGLIIDAGTFLGGSTMCLGTGLQQNPQYEEIVDRWPKPIISLELGITNQQMLLSFKRHGIGEGLKVGDSFGPVLEDHIRPVRDLVDLRLGDILEVGVIADPTRVRQPIEILFLDVLKNPDLCEFCFRQYFPRLVPRRALVIQQDYLCGELPFIHINQEFFGSKFEYVGELSSSAVFRLVRRITDEEIDELFKNPPDGETQIAYVSQAIQRSIDPHRRLIMSLAKLRILQQVRGPEAAKQYLAFIESEYAAQIAQVQYRRVQNVVRAARYLSESDGSPAALMETMKISTGHRGSDHRRTDVGSASD